KYLAFSDAGGMHVKLIQTGETQNFPHAADLTSVPLPEGSQWFPATWFPDGTKFLANIVQPVPERSPSIWEVSVLCGTPHELREGAAAESIAPDGSLVAFTVGAARHFALRAGYVPDREIWVMGISGQDARKVVGTDEGHGVGSVVWSPDSGSIGFIS